LLGIEFHSLQITSRCRGRGPMRRDALSIRCVTPFGCAVLPLDEEWTCSPEKKLRDINLPMYTGRFRVREMRLVRNGFSLKGCDAAHYARLAHVRRNTLR
jgi:hypothetical protein